MRFFSMLEGSSSKGSVDNHINTSIHDSAVDGFDSGLNRLTSDSLLAEVPQTTLVRGNHYIGTLREPISGRVLPSGVGAFAVDDTANRNTNTGHAGSTQMPASFLEHFGALDTVPNRTQVQTSEFSDLRSLSTPHDQRETIVDIVDVIAREIDPDDESEHFFGENAVFAHAEIFSDSMIIEATNVEIIDDLSDNSETADPGRSGPDRFNDDDYYMPE